MYKADDLTEETEKIVLKRARDTRRARRVYLWSNARVRPRSDAQVSNSPHGRTNQGGRPTQNLAWNKDRVELPLALEKQRLDVARQKVQIARSKERLKNLLADQELMKIKAPCRRIRLLRPMPARQISGNHLADRNRSAAAATPCRIT